MSLRFFWRDDMSVELVATKKSDSLRAEKLPALVREGAGGTVRCDDFTPGNYHCLVSLVEGALVVWDLGTPGGTSVNGARVTKAALRSGDTLTLGGTEFQVNYKQRARRFLLGPRS
jgi:hypothetical protein